MTSPSNGTNVQNATWNEFISTLTILYNFSVKETFSSNHSNASYSLVRELKSTKFNWTKDEIAQIEASFFYG